MLPASHPGDLHRPDVFDRLRPRVEDPEPREVREDFDGRVRPVADEPDRLVSVLPRDRDEAEVERVGRALASRDVVFRDARLRTRPRSFSVPGLWTSFTNRLSSTSWYNIASFSSSNFSKKSSQEIGVSDCSPLNPGKSMRRIPGSPRPPVRFTVAGCPPRDSTHCRISS